MNNQTDPIRSAIMRAIKSKNTAPEMLIRSVVHRLGYRFRLHQNDLPGKPDLGFASRRKIIFVHGCFWHGHQCARGNRIPKNNRDYWMRKIRRNRERDATHVVVLEASGWKILIVWECQARLSDELLEKLVNFLG